MSVAPTIDINGISCPQYAEVLAYLQTQYRAIYGDDVYLGNDSQDGQFLGVIAAAINDVNSACVAVYNSFSPQTAQGAGLSSNVKINGIARLVPSKSTTLVTIGGTFGSVITNGVVSDGANQWDLPATVTIPESGEIQVTATAQEEGEIEAAIGTITTISTPVYGWQTVTNTVAATPGSPVESDAKLRVRQAASVALPSVVVFDGILGAVQSVTGVTRVKGYENDTDSTDSNGLPARSISIVAQGGDSAEIAAAIAGKKSPGAYTNGSTAVSVVDGYGVSHTIRYSPPTLVAVSVEVTLTALAGYTYAIADEIKAAIVAYAEEYEIGEDVYISRLYVPAQLAGAGNSSKFKVATLKVSKKPAAVGTSDLTIAWNELATIAAADITVVVL